MLRPKRSVVAMVVAAAIVVVAALLLLSQEFRWFGNSLHQWPTASRFVKSESPPRSDRTGNEGLSSFVTAETDPKASKINKTVISTATTKRTRFHSAAWRKERKKYLSSQNNQSQQLLSLSFPPLSTLIGDRVENITGDVQFLLDFAIIGNFKCGTTTVLQWLKDHDEALLIPYESYALHQGRPAVLVDLLYHLQPTITADSSKDYNTKSGNITFRRGYKCPSDIQESHSMQYIRNYFPKTKLIVGIRHPILWFESFYNFRVQNVVDRLPHANQLIGACPPGKLFHVCTDSGLFHIYLARMGKTDLTDEEVQGSFFRDRNATLEDGNVRPERMPNPVFLYEVTQLHAPRRGSSTAQRDHNYSLQFRRDVQTYLGFQHELPALPHTLPGKSWDDTVDQAARDAQKIRICDDEYLPVRSHLLKQSQEASLWIRRYFLNAPGVVVSSRAYVEILLERWMYDPCDNTTMTT